MTRPIITDPAEREVLLALWAVPGLGPAQLEKLWAKTQGNLRTLWDSKIATWVDDVELNPEPRLFLKDTPSLEQLATWVRQRAKESRARIAFEGDPDYPENLLTIHDRPPVLFHWGQMGTPRKRVAMVGSRQITQDVEGKVRDFAKRISAAGLGIISGGARGVDNECHWGAFDMRGETWAFVACALDQMDRAQWNLVKPILDHGGMVFSEYPAHTVSKKDQFPRRNRLISGSADVVLIVRAARQSGTLRTADHAIAQGRPLLAMAGEHWDLAMAGCHDLLRSGKAAFCAWPEDVFLAARFVPERTVAPPPPGKRLSDLGLSSEAAAVFSKLSRDPQVFEEILDATRMDPADLLSALSELELSGVAVQHPGKQYVRA